MDYTVASVDKALGLLFLVAQQPGLGVTELARRSGNTKARAFRLLDTLEHRGLVQRQADTATYSIGYKAIYLGTSAQEQISLVRLARDYLPGFGARCNENVLVLVRDGMETLCIARWESPHAVRVHTPLGNRKPLHIGASGKLLLAFAPTEVRETVLGGELRRLTANTFADRRSLVEELARIRERDYSASFGEADAGTVSVAAPIRDARGMVVGSLSTSGPASRITRKDVPFFADLVRAGARDLATELGYPLPSTTPPSDPLGRPLST